MGQTAVLPMIQLKRNRSAFLSRLPSVWATREEIEGELKVKQAECEQNVIGNFARKSDKPELPSQTYLQRDLDLGQATS